MALTNVFQADNIKNTSPKCHFTYIFCKFFSLWAPSMVLLTAGALTDTQLPTRASNVYTTDAGRVASAGWPPQTKILATPTSIVIWDFFIFAISLIYTTIGFNIFDDFLAERSQFDSDHDQIWQACADRSGNGSYLNKLAP